MRYKARAKEQTFESVMNLSAGEALRPRLTRLGNMVHTLNHVYVVDYIFRHHLQGKNPSPSPYTACNTEPASPLGDLWSAVQSIDLWYIELVETWST